MSRDEAFERQMQFARAAGSAVDEIADQHSGDAGEARLVYRRHLEAALELAVTETQRDAIKSMPSNDPRASP